MMPKIFIKMKSAHSTLRQKLHMLNTNVTSYMPLPSSQIFHNFLTRAHLPSVYFHTREQTGPY